MSFGCIDTHNVWAQSIASIHCAIVSDLDTGHINQCFPQAIVQEIVTLSDLWEILRARGKHMVQGLIRGSATSASLVTVRVEAACTIEREQIETASMDETPICESEKFAISNKEIGKEGVAGVVSLCWVDWGERGKPLRDTNNPPRGLLYHPTGTVADRRRVAARADVQIELTSVVGRLFIKEEEPSQEAAEETGNAAEPEPAHAPSQEYDTLLRFLISQPQNGILPEDPGLDDSSTVPDACPCRARFV
ncbi:hypothetical protein PRIPAC_76195 [Pristionchus pacificus]|uniref:Uncharacterized protein n=1 Tax=Pristionchus pacificus TaxID=54126 RepID=A0A2A6BZG7_PRIPA|nr:hypothetical protein PRIPAC_71110 [Pristionchus pacificus]KAF8387053.1 hypothetical protein PRIPAC_76195 [Pristionchus pacificus]|eukprot:PDM71247.1 hypothetical protein PRIPAC_37654 [Pristionchus pacificus]